MNERSALPALVRSGPPDIAKMRVASAALLADGASLPRFDDLDERAIRLRGHLKLLIPVVEEAARALPDEHATRVTALAAVANARVRLSASPGPGLVSATQHARSLARELAWLCDHYEALAGTPAVGLA
ncbi:hypothetical protein GCM10018793_44330 [Streptomyces sulfonofaciens]|uniref:Uncharacterized protein n=1 Tax=Streptomyces sulfonofaciens TaxID=68272 RepID=A0A919L320_9ACTN|nr:DUF6415 family natural product biosynthesis protein [Streptomyces sulfonofaciens]GHH83095.1 hypothetical protein GCM10018793_44330 [Streptomyces sulfonofaciens]